MPEPNAEMLIAYVRQDTRFQIIHELEELGISEFIYEELPGIEPGRPTIGRFEIVIWDEEIADKVEKVVLKRGTGYDPPDVTIIRSAVYAKNNG